MRQIFGVIIMLIFGPLLVVGGYIERTQHAQIEANGTETDAIATVLHTRRGRRGSRRYELDIIFFDQAKRKHDAKVSVSSACADRMDTDPHLRIKYLANDPSKLIVIGESGNGLWTMIAGVVLTLIGAVMGYFMFFKSPTPVNNVVEAELIPPTNF